MNLDHYPCPTSVPHVMRAPVTTAELLRLMEVARVAAGILALHDDAVFICGEGDQSNVDKCLGDLRSALAAINE